MKMLFLTWKQWHRADANELAEAHYILVGYKTVMKDTTGLSLHLDAIKKQKTPW